jgi:hypothetical protein
VHVNSADVVRQWQSAVVEQATRVLSTGSEHPRQSPMPEMLTSLGKGAPLLVSRSDFSEAGFLPKIDADLRTDPPESQLRRFSRSAGDGVART